MCPDPQLLSIYMDGELPSPWKEKMESHLAECSKCKEQLKNLLNLQELFKKETGQKRVYAEKAESGSAEKFAISEHELMDKAKERIWQKLESGHHFRSTLAHNRQIYRYSMWKRRVSIPIPAAAAAAIIITILAVSLLRGGSSAGGGLPSYQTASIEEEMPSIIPVGGDLNSVLQYLGVDRSEVIILQLPESGNFNRSGDPAIIRSADYSRR